MLSDETSRLTVFTISEACLFSLIVLQAVEENGLNTPMDELCYRARFLKEPPPEDPRYRAQSLKEPLQARLSPLTDLESISTLPSS